MDWISPTVRPASNSATIAGEASSPQPISARNAAHDFASTSFINSPIVASVTAAATNFSAACVSSAVVAPAGMSRRSKPSATPQPIRSATIVAVRPGVASGSHSSRSTPVGSSSA